jgi:hypothetical protein
VGTNVVVSPNGLSVTFASVSAAGTTTVTVSSTGPAAPAGFNLGSPPTYYDVSTTATVSGPIVLCFSAPSVIDQAQFDLLRVLHGENGVLVDRTILAPDTPAPDFASTTICTRVSSLSPFTLARKSSDTTPPAARPTQTPPANADGWNNTDVTVNWNWMDNTGGTGIDPANCIRSSMSSGQGTLTLKAPCIDLAGNSGSASYTVKIDKTAPVTTATPTSGTLPRLQSLITAIGTATVENTAGIALGTMSFTCFNTTGLNLTLSATDSPSGVARLSYAASGAQTITANTVSASAAQPTVTITITITPRGLTTLTYAATDRAANQESTKSESVIVGTGFACANPSPAFSMPNHGTLLLNGTATANGKSFPFNQSISF